MKIPKGIKIDIIDMKLDNACRVTIRSKHPFIDFNYNEVFDKTEFMSMMRNIIRIKISLIDEKIEVDATNLKVLFEGKEFYLEHGVITKIEDDK